MRTSEKRVFVDAPEVARIVERRVTLTVDAAQAAELPAGAAGWSGRLERRVRRRVDRARRRLGG